MSRQTDQSEEIKTFTDNIKGIQHNHTSFTTNAKGASLERKTQEKENVYIKKSHSSKLNGNKIIYINNYLKCKQTKYSKQKTQIG